VRALTTAAIRAAPRMSLQSLGNALVAVNSMAEFGGVDHAAAQALMAAATRVAPKGTDSYEVAWTPSWRREVVLGRYCPPRHPKHFRGPGRKPGASFYTRKRLSLSRQVI